MDMSKIDVKNYIEKIYGVRVSQVRSYIHQVGRNTKTHRHLQVTRWGPDIRYAFVTLEDSTFKFPKMFPDPELNEVKDEEDAPTTDADSPPATAKPDNPMVANWFKT